MIWTNNINEGADPNSDLAEQISRYVCWPFRPFGLKNLELHLSSNLCGIHPATKRHFFCFSDEMKSWGIHTFHWMISQSIKILTCFIVAQLKKRNHIKQIEQFHSDDYYLF